MSLYTLKDLAKMQYYDDTPKYDKDRSLTYALLVLNFKNILEKRCRTVVILCFKMFQSNC